MKFSKFLAAFLAAVTVLSTAQVSFAASFSERKIALVYTKIVRLTDKKVGKIRNISVANRQKITAARSNLEKSFVSFDAVFRKTPDERTRAGRALVRAYSDLNALIASVAKAPSATSQAVVSASVSEAPKASSAEVAASLSQTADVLYYADAFQDFSTSSGDRFSQSAYSAARCEIQLGRLIQVAYGPRSVIVKANDRPNCTKHPDIVDLSTAAFQSLAPLSKGRLAGSFEVLWQTPSEYRKEPVSTSVFEPLGIKLDSNIPNTYFPGETLRVFWRVTDGKEDTVIFLKSPSGKKFSRSSPVAGGVFSYEIPLLETGRYDLVVASGMGFSTTKTQPIHVLSPEIFATKKILSSAPVTLSVPELRFARKESSDLSPMNVLDLPEVGKKLLRTVRISQPGAETLVRSSMGDVAFFPEDAQRFNPNEDVRVTVTAAESSTDFSMDAFGAETTVFDAEMPLVPSYAVERKEPVSAIVEGSTLRIRTDLDAKDSALRAEAYLIGPKGNVSVHKFASDFVDGDGFVVRGRKAELSVTLPEAGQYLAEVMYSNGFPAFNAPVVQGSGVVPLLPNEYDSAPKDADSNVSDVSSNALRFVNALRKKAGKNALVTDSTLETLARFKANDMADHNYIGHDDSAGQKINGTAKRAGIAVTGGMGENVAGGSVGSDFLLAGLSLSGGHRANMLGEWTKIGVAAVVRNGLTYYVQVFGE